MKSCAAPAHPRLPARSPIRTARAWRHWWPRPARSRSWQRATGDTLEATEAALRAALRGCDLLLTVGGVSVGEHDLVRAALARTGAELEFWKVQIRPGKPLAFGRHGETLILGLPGNPVSAQITFALFGMPLLRAMQGDRQPIPPRGRARLQSALRQNPGRTGFYRAQLQGDLAITAATKLRAPPLAWRTRTRC